MTLNSATENLSKIKLTYFDKALFLLPYALVFIIYQNLITLDPVLTLYDDRVLLQPLQKVKNLTDYLQLRRAGEIVDLQPFRDLLFWIELKIGDLSGTGLFHLMSGLLWCAINFIMYQLLKNFTNQYRLRILLCIFLAIHPVAVGNVGWISAQKHLLASLFILLATLLTLLNSKKSNGNTLRLFVTFILYISSVLSHPLYVLWPIWQILGFILDLRRRKLEGEINRPLLVRAYFIIGALGLLGMLIAIYLNWQYYTTLYVSQAHSSKLAHQNGVEGGVAVLAIGRLFFNLLFPFWIATDYWPGNFQNLIGLFFIPIFLLLAWKLSRNDRNMRRNFALTVGFIVLSLLPTTIRMTNIFTSDTYSLGLLFGTLMLLASLNSGVLGRVLAFESAQLRTSLILIGLGLWVSFNLSISLRETKAWSSDCNRAVQDYSIERSRNTILWLGFCAASRSQWDLAIDLAKQSEDFIANDSLANRLILLASRAKEKEARGSSPIPATN